METAMTILILIFFAALALIEFWPDAPHHPSPYIYGEDD